MKNFVCWDSEDARVIINPDVDAQPDAFFRAVHTDVPIRRFDKKRERMTVVSSEKFLAEFLGNGTATRGHSLVPVVGDSGSGKSHLLRWLNLSIKRDDKREVVWVPKAQANLREIVRQLILKLPKKSQSKYLDMLQGTGTTQLNESAQRTSILNNLQTELTNDTAGKDNTDDEEEYLIKGLSDLFIDPYVRREHFIQDGSFAAELAAHVYERPESYNPTDQRREFKLQDLPFALTSLASAAHDTGEFLGFLLGQDNETKQKAVDIINRHTDAAIARCLNLSGDHLNQIMSEMRQGLKSEGKELILLIEDFARLQGLDRALLQTLINEDRNDQCTLRTAFACTTGYYAPLARTVQTRASFVIDMDNPLREAKDSFKLSSMVARYMNAVRLGAKALEVEWQREKEGETSFDVISHCDECEHQVICHSAFGQENGYGLYPFTKTAIDVMAHRADQNVDEHFNAREFQSKVLQPITQMTAEIRGGQFPPKRLLDDLDGLRNFPLDEAQNVRRQAPQDADRHLTLIALWEGEDQAVNVDKRIQETFNLQPLDVDAPVVPPELPASGPTNPAESPRRTKEADELSRWANNDIRMPQQLANELRPLVFDAVVNFINWDEVGLPKTTWAGSGGVFKQANLHFVNQSTQKRLSLINLEIPLNWEDDEDRTTTYSALTGIIEATKRQSWNIEGANNKFICLQECLQAWADNLIDQMQILNEGTSSWDPVKAALELRVLGVLLSTPQGAVPDNLNLVEMGLGPFGDQTLFVRPELEKMFHLIEEKKEYLFKVVRDGVSATKGGQTGNFLNSNALVDAMRHFKKRGYALSDAPAKDELLLPFHREVVDLANKIRGQIDDSLQKEVEERLNWLDRVSEAFNEETDEKQISETIRKTMKNISSLSVSGFLEANQATELFARANFTEAVRLTRDLRNRKEIRPFDVAFNIKGPMKSSDELIDKASKVFQAAKRKIEAEMETKGYDPTARDSLLEQTKDNLDLIFDALGGDSDA